MHSPIPWHRNIKPASKYPVIFSGQNTHVCQVISRGLTDDQVEANCDLIVAAVNFHETMRAILSEAVEAWKIQFETDSEINANDFLEWFSVWREKAAAVTIFLR